MMKQDILVFETSIPVEVSQVAEADWTATGTYLSKCIEVKGKSAEAALALWQKTAENRGK